mmetsp:Transcript_25461/g.55420  ORF Transcript_25461/g.55420 Transcript_25461/m.55420 type:complete len:83 (-) Transcript_25461:154-402(-)
MPIAIVAQVGHAALPSAAPTQGAVPTTTAVGIRMPPLPSLLLALPRCRAPREVAKASKGWRSPQLIWCQACPQSGAARQIHA